MQSSWQHFFARTLAGQAYPLLIFDDGVIAAASLWAHIREWVAVFRLSELHTNDRILLCLPSNRAFVCLLCAALHENLHISVLSVPAPTVAPTALYRALNAVQHSRPFRLCVMHHTMYQELRALLDHTALTTSLDTTVSEPTNEELISPPLWLSSVITPALDHRPPEFLRPLLLVPPVVRTLNVALPRIEGYTIITEALTKSPDSPLNCSPDWSVSDNELHALVEHTEQARENTTQPPQHIASHSWNTREGLLALVEGLCMGAEILRLPEHASQQECTAFAASYGIVLPPQRHSDSV